MGERVTVSYRGAAYELGRGKHSYGIWAVGASRTAPVERWPETPEGWNAAWARFTGIEAPGTIVAASSGAGLGVTASVGAATALLAIGVLCGVIGLFPGYLGGQSLVSQPVLLVPHVLYLAAWTLSAVLILTGGVRQRAGALLGIGTSIVTFGFFFTDVGTVLADGSRLMDAGMWFGLVGWLACAAGSAMACLIRTGGAAGPVGKLGIPRGLEVARAGLLILAGIGTAIAFAPSWDSYLLRTATGTSESVIAGNAFSNPGWVIAGNLAVMIAFGLVVISAALWRPLKLGAMLLAGAVIPMAAQAISALVQVGEATPSTQFNISPSQASQLGLTISNGLTATFWIYCVLIVVLVVSCAWMLITPSAAVVTAQAPTVPPVPPVWAEEEDRASDWDDEDDDVHAAHDDDVADSGPAPTPAPTSEPEPAPTPVPENTASTWPLADH